jgi:hypothetical protein
VNCVHATPSSGAKKPARDGAGGKQVLCRGWLSAGFGDGCVKGSAEFGADGLRLAVELDATDFEHAWVGDGVLGERLARGEIEAGTLRAHAIENRDDVALLARGEEGTPLEMHRGR